VSDGWMSPVPKRMGGQVRVWRPGRSLHAIADIVSTRAWTGRGVRVFHWPDGTWAIVAVDTTADIRMVRECAAFLFATYARGALFTRVLTELRWADREAEAMRA